MGHKMLLVCECEFFRGKISVILTDTESTCFGAISIQLIFILFTKSF